MIMTTRILFMVVLLMFGLAGCGQKGPLYSPHPSKSNIQSVGQQVQNTPLNKTVTD